MSEDYMKMTVVFSLKTPAEEKIRISLSQCPSQASDSATDSTGESITRTRKETPNTPACYWYRSYYSITHS